MCQHLAFLFRLFSILLLHTVAAAQEILEPYLFDLTKITEYHPWLSKPSEIVSEIVEGIGAKRKLNLIDGSFIYETVSDINDDSVHFEVTEHPYPCDILYAEYATERLSEKRSIFKVAFEYKLKEGVSREVAEGFCDQIMSLVDVMANKVMGIFDTHTLFAPLTLGDCLTLKSPDDVADPDADAPQNLGTVKEYEDFFTKPELYQHVHIHMIGVKSKDAVTGYVNDSGGVAELNAFGFRSILSSPDPMIVAEAKGMDIGSTEDFPVGKIQFAVSARIYFIY